MGPFEERIELRAVSGILWRRRWWVIISVGVCIAVAVAAILLIRPEYRATAVLIHTQHEKGGAGLLGSALGQLGGLASAAGLGGSADSEAQEALAVLASRQFTETFIREHGLMPLMFPKKWDAAAKRWRGAENKWPSLADGYRHFDQEIRTVSRNKDTGLVTLNITWTDPKQGAAWANTLVQMLNQEMRRRAIDRTSSSLEYLEKELIETQAVETRDAISRLVEAQINQRMLANVTQEYAFRFVDPALPADEDDKVWPPALLFLAGALFVGVGLGVCGALLMHALRETPAPRS